MHRSGTSMVARALKTMGLELGPEEALIPGDSANIEGYWEHRGIVALHDELLSRFGGSWESPPEFPPGWYCDSGIDDLRARTKDVISSIAIEGPWGWKDPRGSLTLPFWLDLFPEAHVVLCVRDPAEVAASLKRRSYLSDVFSQRLWQQYNASVLTHAYAERLTVTHYSNWLTDASAEVERVAALLPFKAAPVELRSAIAVANPDLRNNEPLTGDEAVARIATASLGLYVQLCELAGLAVPTALQLASRLHALERAFAETTAELRDTQARRLDDERRIAELSLALEAEAERRGIAEQDMIRALADRDRTVEDHKATIGAGQQAMTGLDQEPHDSRSVPEASGDAGRLSQAAVDRRLRREDYESLKARMREAVAAAIPVGATVAVTSRGDDELLDLGDRIGCHFPCAEDGNYAGFHPKDDSLAIAHLEATRSRGATHLVFPATSLWWLDHYKLLSAHLTRRYSLAAQDESCVIFDLRRDTAVRAPGSEHNGHSNGASGASEAGTPGEVEGPALALSTSNGSGSFSGAHEDDVAIIQRSGLFDDVFYRASYPAACSTELSPIEHFCTTGWQEGKQPNAYFDTEWYIRVHPELDPTTNPLVDYISSGESRRPCALFAPAFYASSYCGGRTVGALADYLAHVGAGEWRNPTALFDVDFYLTEHPDVRGAGIDPVRHYLHYGHKEGRDPSPLFTTDYYRRKHLGGETEMNPLVHYYEAGEAAGYSTRFEADADDGVHGEVRRRVSPGPEYEDFDATIAAKNPPRVKALAFYLPQFHAFPENDRWWGEGFTEWRNVARGMPRFGGHYQPRVPRDLGFYDLTDQRTLRKQVDLARASGLHGFAFYYYWFNGKRLLERPLDQFLADKSLDFNFCVVWANENWTRRWDGRDQEILMRQDYSEEYDEALVDDLQRYFADDRYIRVDGRPLMVIYRLDIIPDGERAINRWRDLWRSRHGEDPFILIAQTFGVEDPRPFDADGAVEFPPHKLTSSTRSLNSELAFLDPSFTGWVFDYSEVATISIEEPFPDYPLVKTALPSWDNDARLQGKGTVLHGSSPALFEEWLRVLVNMAEDHPVGGESIVCINAWNEWAEAAYLEPDVHYGAAYLNATARALCAPRSRSGTKRKILLVGHDALSFGAQINLWHMGDTLRNQFGCEVAFILKAGGEMVADYERVGNTFVSPESADWDTVIEQLRSDGYELALVNSVVSGNFVPHLKRAGYRVVSLIHELSQIIEEHGLFECLVEMVGYSDKVVVPAQFVADGIASIAPGLNVNFEVRPQGLYKRLDVPAESPHDDVRAELGIPSNARIVLNVGSGDLRKGVDTFVHVAKCAVKQDPSLHFVWVGKPNVHVTRWLERDLREEFGSHVHFVDYTNDVSPYYAAADVFFLSSREDPFPSVVLEALSVGLPVLALTNCSGMGDVVEAHGRVLPSSDFDAIAGALSELAYEDDLAAREARTNAIRESFRFDEYCFDLLRMLDPELRKVSVVVPNFNYRKYLADRLESVFDQTYPVFEVVVLDDCSTDGSVRELELIRDRTGRHFEVVTNSENSASVFLQWRNGCELARGEAIWLAEADDSCAAEFLERLVPAQARGDAVLAFADSASIDEGGTPLSASYKDYYRTAAGDLMEHDFVLDGAEFVRQCLVERNLILNVSAVVWNREALRDAVEASLEDLRGFRLAGDWYLYVMVALQGGNVAYVAEPLNVHRRHRSSVTGSLDTQRHLDEVKRVHRAIATRMDLTGSVRGRIANYEAELATRFGLTAKRRVVDDRIS
jgi:glycosyltransferase involved in cell wall biosynthesis